nr:ethylene-responsive transcription factor 1B-like [Tanacetum cinerariifolium]
MDSSYLTYTTSNQYLPFNENDADEMVLYGMLAESSYNDQDLSNKTTYSPATKINYRGALQNADKYKEEARSVLLNTKENVNPQEKRPALVRKRAKFSMKPNGSDPCTILEPTLQMDQPRDPDDKEFSFGLESLVDNEVTETAITDVMHTASAEGLSNPRDSDNLSELCHNMEEKEEDGNIGSKSLALNTMDGNMQAEEVEKAASGTQLSLNDNGHPRSVQEMDEIVRFSLLYNICLDLRYGKKDGHVRFLVISADVLLEYHIISFFTNDVYEYVCDHRAFIESAIEEVVRAASSSLLDKATGITSSPSEEQWPYLYMNYNELNIEANKGIDWNGWNSFDCSLIGSSLYVSVSAKTGNDVDLIPSIFLSNTPPQIELWDF